MNRPRAQSVWALILAATVCGAQTKPNELTEVRKDLSLKHAGREIRAVTLENTHDRSFTDPSQGPQQDKPSEKPSTESLDRQLTRLLGVKKTIFVIRAKEGTFWTFQTERIKMVTGTAISLKRGSPFATCKSDAPEAEVVDALASKWDGYGKPHIPWGGYWFTTPPPGRPGTTIAGISGLTTKEMVLEVTALLKVEVQGK